jgi:integrative and conjugative element protein (TIGR02256 family)
VILLPKQRQSGGEIEHNEYWAFLLSKEISHLGVALGLWEIRGVTVGRILGGTVNERLIDETLVDVLNPTFTLSRAGAAALNGTNPSSLRIAAVGLGALGSQVVTNLVRSGFGVWMGIDEDFVLPHNAARHEVTQWEVGLPKVQSVQLRLNAILDEAAMTGILETNVLRPGAKSAQLEAALTDSDVILDLSANLAVGRKLAHYPNTDIRRCSLFLNPSGSDLVLLCEDQARKVRLDWLEFQYYRALINQKDLADHFRQEPGRIRYGQSCRDLTSTVPQHLVAMHSGIAARALQQCLVQDEAVLRIWSSDDSLNVHAHRIEQFPVLKVDIEGWQIRTDEAFVQKIVRCRKNKLPKETGGVLVGGFDQQNRILYLVDVIPSPPDSEEWPTLYIRGRHGLEGAVNQVSERSDGQLQYMGEWHSHPKGHSTEPSNDDKKVLEWLAKHTARDGNPPVMLIVGEKDVRIFLGSIDHWVTIKQAKR